jgi:hypothetical protein
VGRGRWGEKGGQAKLQERRRGAGGSENGGELYQTQAHTKMDDGVVEGMEREQEREERLLK